MPPKKVPKSSVKKVSKKPGSTPRPAQKKSAPGSPAKAKSFKKAKDALNANTMTEARKDLGQHGSVAIARLPAEKRRIAEAMDRVIREVVPGCDSVVKWGNACYWVLRLSQTNLFAALIETKAGINLALPGSALADPDGLLEGTGKVMRHVKLKSIEDVRRAGVANLIRLAAEVGIKGM